MLSARRPMLLVLLLALSACAGSRSSLPPWYDDGGGALDSNSGSFDGKPADRTGAGLEQGIYPEGGGCGPSSCTGCCSAGGCVAGYAGNQCGSGGVLCSDCTAAKSICQQRRCVGCTPSCSGKKCGDSDGCGGACKAGSGCCTPVCTGKTCGVADGCGTTCQPGSGCCSPACAGKKCGDSDGCGSTCQPGSGCCTPSCSGKKCGDSDGCSGTCQPGSGCCSAGCSGKSCGDSDGCGGTCSGLCPGGWATCDSSNTCRCGSYPNYKVVGGICLPSCGNFLRAKKLQDGGGGCCSSGCKSGTFGGGPGETHDCVYCCSSPPGVSSCR